MVRFKFVNISRVASSINLLRFKIQSVFFFFMANMLTMHLALCDLLLYIYIKKKHTLALGNPGMNIYKIKVLTKHSVFLLHMFNMMKFLAWLVL